MNHLVKIVQFENINLNAGKVDENNIALPENFMKVKKTSFMTAINPILPATGASIKTAIKNKQSYTDVVEETLTFGSTIIDDTDVVNMGRGTLVYEVTLTAGQSISPRQLVRLTGVQRLNELRAGAKAKYSIGRMGAMSATVTSATGTTATPEPATGTTAAAPKVTRAKKVKGGTTVTPATGTTATAPATGTTGA